MNKKDKDAINILNESGLRTCEKESRKRAQNPAKQNSSMSGFIKMIRKKNNGR